MLLTIPQVLGPDQLAQCREALATAPWADGRATAGYQSERVKHNQQIPESDPVARKVGDMLLTILERHPTFMSAALPLKVVPPLFNRYQGGGTYGTHIDGAIRPVPGGGRVRTDLSATLFLTPPEDYDGGELCIEHSHGVQRFKQAAGDLVLYPGTSLHRVEPVTKGARVSCFFWIQSMVRDDGQRTILFDLDNSIQEFARAVPDNPAVLRLTGVYHNLLRQWADA